MEEIWAWNPGVLVPADGLLAMGEVVELSPVCLALTCSRTRSQGPPGKGKAAPGSLDLASRSGSPRGHTPLGVSKAHARPASGSSTPFCAARCPQDLSGTPDPPSSPEPLLKGLFPGPPHRPVGSGSCSPGPGICVDLTPGSPKGCSG